MAVAKFKFTRQLRLLNLNELEKIHVKGSLYNEEYAEQLSRVQFLYQLCEKVSLPVMPGEEDAQYLVTQAIADYLSIDESISLDGIVFPSIQTKKGYNVVPFHKASKVVPRDMPARTEVSVRLWEHDEGGAYPSFSVLEETPRDMVSGMITSSGTDLRSPSLAIEEKGIKIHIIQEVKFTSEPHDLYVHRSKKVD